MFKVVKLSRDVAGTALAPLADGLGSDMESPSTSTDRVLCSVSSSQCDSDCSSSSTAGVGVGGAGDGEAGTSYSRAAAGSSSSKEQRQGASSCILPSSSLGGCSALAQHSGIMSGHSIVDSLLAEIYHDPFGLAEASTGHAYFTECSAESSSILGANETVVSVVDGADAGSQPSALVASTAYLESKDIDELKALAADMKERIAQLSVRLVGSLKRMNRSKQKVEANCELVTATLQAFSEKRREDSQLRFSLTPHGGEEGFLQWKAAYQAIGAHICGIPGGWRGMVWLCAAEHALQEVDWPDVKRFAFNDKSNPDDDNLGIQIVKDLHRTGCSDFCGQNAVRERAILKRVLLGYARWNKSVGYCQGFNILAAVLLQVLNNSEEKALKIMIFIVDHLLPANYFTNNLSTLQADMVVFRVMMKRHLPRLWNHLRFLQEVSIDFEFGLTSDESLISHEPPLTDVFTVQWFLTAFATCLPMDTVLRVWDLLILHGAEILFRVGLAVWSLLERHLLLAETSTDFYSMMSSLSKDMLSGAAFSSTALIERILQMAPFPFPGLQSLCDNHRYNIHPLTSTATEGESDTSCMSDKDVEAVESEPEVSSALVGGCFSGFSPMAAEALSKTDVRSILRTAHPALAVLSPNFKTGATVKKVVEDVATLERNFSRRQIGERRVIVRFDPMPLSRNIEPVKGHTMGRQRHQCLSVEKGNARRSKAGVGLAAAATAPLSTVLAEQQTSARPFRSQHIVRARHSSASLSSDCASWSRSAVGAAQHRLLSSGSGGSAGGGAGVSHELSRGGTSLHDVITSHHSSVLDGTDVEFTESAFTTPVKLRDHHSPTATASAAGGFHHVAPARSRQSSQDVMSSRPLCSPQLDRGSEGHARRTAQPGLSLHERQHPVAQPPSAATGQLVTTADEDAQTKRMCLASHPDLLVCVDPLPLTAAQGDHTPQPPTDSCPLPMTTEAIAAVASRLENRSPYEQIRSGDRPDILRSLGSSSDEPNTAASAETSTARGRKEQWGVVDLTPDASSCSDERTPSPATPTDHARPCCEDVATRPRLRDRGKKVVRKDRRGAAHQQSGLGPGRAAGTVSSDSSDCDDLMVCESATRPGEVSRDSPSQLEKKKLMAPVWQNHHKNLRRIQKAAGESRSACSLHSGSGRRGSLQTPSTSSPSSPSPSAPSPVPATPSGAHGSLPPPRPAAPPSATWSHSPSWRQDRDAVLQNALTGVM